MATYGYAGDFSSDDDEKVGPTQASALDEDQNRLSKAKIEEYIEKIKKLPYDDDITLTHDALAGILDYYKIQRGPIVDSTRKLYTKIALRSVRDDMGKESGGMDGPAKELNGNSINNDNNASQQTSADTFSSDDEDIEITGVKNGVKNFDIGAARNNNNNIVENDEDDQMDVDSEDHYNSGTPPIVKPIDLVTTEEDDDENSTTSDESEIDDDGSNNESYEPKMTPIKPLTSATREKEAIEVLLAMHPSTPKPSETTSLRRQPLAHSTPKDSATDATKKPYTRSQRVTRSATKGGKDMKKLDSSSSSVNVFIEKKQGARRNYAPVVLALIVLGLGFLAYHFRSSILTTTEPLFRKKLRF